MKTTGVACDVSPYGTDLRAEVVELSILKSPQHVLCLVSTDAKVETVKWHEELLPNLQQQDKILSGVFLLKN